MNVSANQTSCEGKCCDSKGGNAVCPAWPSLLAVVSAMTARLDAEQQQQRDQQREDAERLGDGEPEDQVAELALRGGRVADRGGEIVAEDDADADAGAAHAEAGKARTDVFRCNWIHNKSSFWFGWIGFGSMTRMNRVVEVDAGEDREHV